MVASSTGSPTRNWRPTWKSFTTTWVCEEDPLRDRQDRDEKTEECCMKRLIGVAALAALLAGGAAHAQVTVKVGVLSDMSSLYSDIGGAGSVAAAKLAVADFTKTNPNVKVELISGDHQNKPDIGSQLANQWYDVDKVDMIIDTPNSGVALAVSEITKQKNKLFIVSGAAASTLTGAKCNANTIHWTY